MTDDTVIDAKGVFEAVSKAGASKPDKPKKARGINYKPSTREKREALTRVLPIIKQQRADRIERAKRGNNGNGFKTTYDREKLNRIFARMAEGQSAQEAQRAEGLAASTFQDWLEHGGGDVEEALSCRQAYARAREALADASFSMALDVPKQLYAMAIGEGEADAPPVDSATVQAAKLLTDSLRWYAERLAPSRYADKKADVPIVNVTNNSLTISGRDLSPEQRGQLRQLLSAASQPPLIEG